jgi:ATP-dependent Lhr-like helicase
VKAAPAESALSAFHPVVADWFRREVGEPTEVQRAAWPVIAAGRHVLVTAPTGSGKTLTAFLWALDRLLSGAWPGGKARVLYVSPLKALNNDIERNLLAPLAGLESAFAASGDMAHPVAVRTRSGDTPPAERQRMVRHPPEILITTPESLNLLLASKGGRSILEGLRTVILDEVHAVAGSKRGTHLITAVERLVALTGEVQRIALSATVKPLERVARFIGGYQLSGRGEAAVYRPRTVEIVRSAGGKRYDLRVDRPAGASGADGGGPEGERQPPALDLDAADDFLWQELAREFKGRIRRHRSTLVFANSRRTVERITRHLNEDEEGELAYSHHGSLSREIRSVVEQRLKEGRLKAIAATNSLELGIDIGALDEVILLQTPPTIASAVQRIGRAGHGVGEVSRGRLYPLFGRDYVNAAVVAKAILEQDIEEVVPVEGPLDVLAQVILSMTLTEEWPVDDLYASVRTADPYRHLPRAQFDLVLEMLAGRYADTRLRELEPRIAFDRIAGTVRARRGAARLVYLSGGTIPDRGYFHLRHSDSMAKIGELDEEFVWERSLGDTFTLGAQSWRIVRITHNDVLVTPAPRGAAMAPFWRAEARNRSFHFAERIAEFLEIAEGWLAERGGQGARHLAERLEGEHCMSPAAAAALVDLLERQRAATGAPLPHRHHLLVERFRELSNRRPGEEGWERVVLHTGWGGRVNRPLAIALAAAWEDRHGFPLEIEADNDAILVSAPQRADVRELLDLVPPEGVEDLLRRRLERTGFFGAQFRENAGRALLLPRADPRRRVPLWLNRERSKKLLDAVSRHQDFPVVVETWRACLRDEFELEPLKRMLAEVASGEVRWSEVRTEAPSPFSAGLIWQQTNRLMYEDDVPEGGGGPSLSRGLLKDLVFASRLRPRLPAELLDRFQRKLHRTWPGYAPQNALELEEWVRERVALTEGEWRELLAAIEGDGGDRQALVDEIGERVVRSAVGHRVHVEVLPRFEEACGGARAEAGEGEADRSAGRAQLVAEWLRYYGPVARAHLQETFSLDDGATRDLLESLTAEETVVVDQFRAGVEAASDDELEICDAENLERLLRLLRAEGRPAFETLPLDRLPLFLAAFQGVAARAGDPAALRDALDRLLGFPAPAAQWESDLLPARLDPYYPAWLDAALQESDLLWWGCGPERLTFAFPGDLRLLRDAESETAAGDLEKLFPDPRARYALDDLARTDDEAPSRSTAELTESLWQLAWQGQVTNSTFLAVRRGILSKFEPSDTGAAADAGGPRVRPRFDRWRASRPWVGDWRRVDAAVIEEEGEQEPLDAIDREELNKERVRLVLGRYGVVFRELLARELPALRWANLSRSLRLMELSGEVVAGRFFDGIHGLQFASPQALRRLSEGLEEDAIYWMSAADPASPSGLGLDDLRGEVPPRLASSHLVYHGSRLVVVSRRNGGELEIRVAPDHPHMKAYLQFLKVLLTRGFDPLKAIDVETINSEPAPRSPYAPVIVEEFAATREPKSLRLRRRY